MKRRQRACSAHEAASLTIGFMGGALLLVVVAIVILILGAGARPWLWLVPVLVVVEGVGLVVSTRLLERAVAMESEAGYTTLRFAARRWDEIDTESGGVVRRAGEGRITREERRRRTAIVRSARRT